MSRACFDSYLNPAEFEKHETLFPIHNQLDKVVPAGYPSVYRYGMPWT